jgi:hypothetical protein
MTVPTAIQNEQMWSAVHRRADIAGASGHSHTTPDSQPSGDLVGRANVRPAGGIGDCKGKSSFIYSQGTRVSRCLATPQATAPGSDGAGVALAQVQLPPAKTPVRPAQRKARAATGTTGLPESRLTGHLGSDRTRAHCRRRDLCRLLTLNRKPNQQLFFASRSARERSVVLMTLRWFGLHKNRLRCICATMSDADSCVSRTGVPWMATRCVDVDKPLPTPSLTERERQIIRLVCEGHSNKEVARKLSGSRRGVGWN